MLALRGVAYFFGASAETPHLCRSSQMGQRALALLRSDGRQQLFCALDAIRLPRRQQAWTLSLWVVQAEKYRLQFQTIETHGSF